MNPFEENYAKNMNSIRMFNKKLFKQIEEEDISHLELLFNNKGEINISHNGYEVYPEYGDAIIEKQVDNFLKKPNIYYHKPFKNEYNKVSKYSYKITSKLESSSPLKEGTDLMFRQIKHPRKIPFLILFGIGSGSYIEKILREKEVLNLFIVDKDYSFFKLSLHLMDWTRIFQKFSRKEGSFNIIVGKDPKNLSYEIINQIYAYNPMYTFYIQYLVHLNSDFFITIKESLAENMFHAQTGWGFFEDERISLQHTLSNIKKTSKVFNPNGKPLDMKVFIIGAGPSLDDDIEEIKLIKDNVVIISCGSSLRTLWKNEITPDFHIETERKNTINKVLSYVDKDYLKQITLIGLNVLHPRVKNKFKNFYLLTRGNDSGSSLFETNEEVLDFTNPTAVNCALNLAYVLRFKNIYLFGVDNGFRDPSMHHSKSNIHSDESIKNYRYKRNDFHYTKEKYEGNFGDLFYSTPTLLWCKQRLENCITHYQKKALDIKVYNCSDGLLIKKAKSLKFNVNEFKNTKKDITLVHEKFTNFDPILDTSKIKKEINRQNKIFKTVLDEITNYNKEFDLKESQDVVIYMDYLFSIVRNSKTDSQIVYSFLGHSLKTLNSYIYIHLLSSTKDEDFNKEFAKVGIEIINEFINYSYKEFKKIVQNENNFLK